MLREPKSLLSPLVHHTSGDEEYDIPLEAKKFSEKAADWVSLKYGSWSAVFRQLSIFILWIAWNLFMLPVWLRFDQGFVGLNLFLSVEAAFSSSFILMSNRRNDQRVKALLEEIRITSLRTDALILHQESQIEHLQRMITQMEGLINANKDRGTTPP